MLQIKNLKSGYNKMEILKGVDFEVGSSEIATIIGPNGAGKSTLLKSIFNLADVYSGEIFFKGENITKIPAYKLIYKGISYVPQGRQVFSGLSVKENLEMGGFFISDKFQLKENIQKVFKKFSLLEKKQDEYAFKLSGGEQQILALGRTLVQDPSLLLLDEPSLGLSPKAMQEIFKIIKQINREGVSVVVVEQNAKKAMEIANIVYVLENGKVASKGAKEDLKEKKLKDIYLGGNFAS